MIAQPRPENLTSLDRVAVVVEARRRSRPRRRRAGSCPRRARRRPRSPRARAGSCSGRGSPRGTAARQLGVAHARILITLWSPRRAGRPLPGSSRGRSSRGSSRRRRAGHQRLAAVVAGADGDAVEVEDLRHVVRVYPLDVERDDARRGGRPAARRARCPGSRRAARARTRRARARAARSRRGRSRSGSRPRRRTPTASAIGGVPASNLCGRSPQVVLLERAPCGSCGRRG